jgi:uncharacterized membrane protein YccF (DUF307 family)
VAYTLAAVPPRPFNLPWALASVAAHVLIVGIPTALAARQLLGSR